MKISALDWRNLSMLYQDLADAVLNYRVANSKVLSLAEKDSLNLAFGQLLNASETFADQALSQALVDIEASVKNLQVVAHDAIEAVQALAKLKCVLDIAASAVTLASALLAPTPGTVTSALSGLVIAVQAAKSLPANQGSAAGSGQ
jgi:hypothetical protein